MAQTWAGPGLLSLRYSANFRRSRLECRPAPRSRRFNSAKHPKSLPSGYCWKQRNFCTSLEQIILDIKPHMNSFSAKRLDTSWGGVITISNINNSSLGNSCTWHFSRFIFFWKKKRQQTLDNQFARHDSQKQTYEYRYQFYETSCNRNIKLTCSCEKHSTKDKTITRTVIQKFKKLFGIKWYKIKRKTLLHTAEAPVLVLTTDYWFSQKTDDWK